MITYPYIILINSSFKIYIPWEPLAGGISNSLLNFIYLFYFFRICAIKCKHPQLHNFLWLCFLVCKMKLKIAVVVKIEWINS